MEIVHMPQDDCRALLARASVARLACSRNDQPYVVPVFFAYEPEYIYVFSTVGKKIEWMRDNPKVCLQIDDVKDRSEWASVIVNGRYEELAVPQYQAEHEHAVRCSRKSIDGGSTRWLSAGCGCATRRSNPYSSALQSKA